MQLEADPNLIVYFNGQYIPMAEARVGILTHALHYGTGVFEGIRAHWNESQQELFVLRPLEHYGAGCATAASCTSPSRSPRAS